MQPERLIWEEHIFSPICDKAQRARQDQNNDAVCS